MAEEQTQDVISPSSSRRSRRLRRAGRMLMLLGSVLLALLCISQPFDLQTQLVFVMVLWVLAMAVRRMPGRFASLLMIMLSLLVSCRYLWWRYSSTLNWDDPLSLFFGLLLLAAETYAWLVLVLGYFQSLWPLHRQPTPLTVPPAEWPVIDIMVPTYNEPLSVVKPTIYAALGIDWPRDKLNIYLLDDGDRPSFRAFAEEAGVNYIARPTHEHAKAGNLNHALKQARGEFVAIFDCDHVPTRTFLQLTMGWFFKDKKLAMLQTPHHFFSPDPFERNLGRFGHTPNEGSLFYGLLQDGNDMWDATFFCGSCAVIRRSALDEVGGIAVETVTEDAHTSLRLHRLGYTSAYIRIPQAAGLATESLSAHIGQRIRWARGMVQIFRLDNPLLGKGLKLTQRLCYANAMLHFLSGIPRLIFLTAPLAFLLLHAYIIYAPALAIALYMLPHMIHANLTNSRIQGKYRYSFWSEVYESVLAWYIARPTTVALFNPHKGTFNVTAKGGLVEQSHVDWEISRPYLILVLLNFCGLIAGGWRLAYGDGAEIPTVILSLGWVLFNMLILGGAIAVAVEARQVRQSHRVDIALPAAVKRRDGHLFPCTVRDYSDGGVGIELRQDDILREGEPITLLLRQGQRECAFPATVRRRFGTGTGLQLGALSREQHIAFIQCTFARADTWARWQEEFARDKPMASLTDVLALGWSGFQSLLDYLPSPLARLFVGMSRLLAWLGSFIPRTPRTDTLLPGSERALVQS
ncbi:UDP-forming cellulose synthase catalytic subunit [Oceanisphaera psychrotolerans]|uniref:Cellulose synthase catalytic subunit [UDP-forming] n=1 Tax=Oceanisphaera psychrotolerans TaxID=1414654 RepID=A0A1J4QEA9_9GAMM|nr:UDP-forming cellulose synthase catalytic subunit [Oceanisphaera psychrotolerans]OIN11953.1 UDP-forming cellulose synthase catalytic subunit [Oceanisphaera psychrotolerans]